MDLLDIINNCSDEELDSIIDKELALAIKNSEKNKRLGFKDGGLSISKIAAHKGFISPDSRVKFSNFSMYTYLMSSYDYFYEFARFVKKLKVNSKNQLVYVLGKFINSYFGLSDGIDRRDAFFEKIVDETTNTDEEFFEKIERLQISDFKGKNIAMCTERAAVAQNLLALFGFAVYYCMGCVERNGKIEDHCFNIARGKNAFQLLDYSLLVPLFYNNKVYNFVKFQDAIEFSEIDDVLMNGVYKSFSDYEYIMTSNSTKPIKVMTGGERIYVVGETSVLYKGRKK